MGALVAGCAALLARMAQVAAQATAAAVLAALAFGLAVIGAALAILALALRGLAEYAGALVKALCVAVAVFGAALAFYPSWQAFGGDVAALLPAGALVLSPVAFALTAGLQFGGLALSGVVTFIMGNALPYLQPLARGLLVMACIGATMARSLIQRMEDDNESET